MSGDWENPVEYWRRMDREAGIDRSGGGLTFDSPRLRQIGNGLTGIINGNGGQQLHDVTPGDRDILDRRVRRPNWLPEGYDPVMLGRQPRVPQQPRTDAWLAEQRHPGGYTEVPTGSRRPSGGVDPMYGSPLGEAAPVRPGAAQAGSTYADSKQQWYQERQRAIDDAAAAVAGQYSGALDELRSRLGAYQVGDRDVQAAYKDFQADVERIGVGVEAAEGLDDTAVVEAVETSYDQAEGVLGEAFAAIDASGNGGMSNALQAEMRIFEDSIVDSLRTDLASMDSLHGLSSDYAEALAGFAYADDRYQAENQRMLLKAQFDKEIKDQKDAIARTQAEMAAAVETARTSTKDAYGEFEMDIDTVRSEAFRQYALGKGISEEEAGANWGVVTNIMTEYGERIVTANDFRNYTNQYVNQSNFAKMGLDVQLQNYLDGVTPEMFADQSLSPPELDMAMARETANRERKVQMMYSGDWSAAIRGDGFGAQAYADQLGSMGIDASGMFRKAWDNPDEFDAVKENELLMDGWSLWTKTENNWDTVRAAGANFFTDDQLSKAPNGYTFPTVGETWEIDGGGYGSTAPSGSINKGVDIGGLRGSPVVSSINGKVERSGWSDQFGFYVRVRDNDGNLHKFQHLDEQPRFSTGASITAGMQIGAIGRTGTSAGSAPALHYEIWNREGQNLDPTPWLTPTGGW